MVTSDLDWLDRLNEGGCGGGFVAGAGGRGHQAGRVGEGLLSGIASKLAGGLRI